MVAEMRMIRWICDFTRVDRIRNGVIRDLAKVAPSKVRCEKQDSDGLAT